MARVDDAEDLWGTATPRTAPGSAEALSAIGLALLAIAQPDLFGHAADAATLDRLAALRRRRHRARRRRAAEMLLAEPWSIDGSGAASDAITLARRFLRRHPERDRADPAPPLLTSRQEAALWHIEEEAAEECFRRDAW
ncbi:MAG: hypothetical protein KIS68_13530 [Bauldia sp.]|nr:hypothetical protein [Bauldia sp.]